jgi:hypothetical protein
MAVSLPQMPREALSASAGTVDLHDELARSWRDSPPVNTQTTRSAVGKAILRCVRQHAAGRANATSPLEGITYQS